MKSNCQSNYHDSLCSRALSPLSPSYKRLRRRHALNSRYISLPHRHMIQLFCKQVPFYEGEVITFDVVPTKLKFKVNYKSVILKVILSVGGLCKLRRKLKTGRQIEIQVENMQFIYDK